MTPHLASWTPASDTAEIRTDLRGPWFERETVELHLLDLRPALTRTRYQRPTLAARLTVLWLRVLASPFAGHLRAAWRAAFWPTVVCSGVVVGLALLWATRGVFVDWTGFHPIPTEAGTR